MIVPELGNIFSIDDVLIRQMTLCWPKCSRTAEQNGTLSEFRAREAPARNHLVNFPSLVVLWPVQSCPHRSG